jgi:hypothetical protein
MDFVRIFLNKYLLTLTLFLLKPSDPHNLRDFETQVFCKSGMANILHCSVLNPNYASQVTNDPLRFLREKKNAGLNVDYQESRKGIFQMFYANTYCLIQHKININNKLFVTCVKMAMN